MKRQNLLIATLLALTLTTAGCQNSGSDEGMSNFNENMIKVNPNKEIYSVGISQYVRHEALDAATKGFKDAVKTLLNKENRDVEFIEVNSQGETSLCTVSASSLVSRNVDLILANATPTFQAAVNVTREIPIIGTSITSYESALGRKIKDDIIGTNASGTTDLPPLKKQAEMIFDLLGNVKNIGLLYCSSEANSLYQIEHIEQYIKDIAKTKNINDITTTRYSFVDSNEIEQIARKACLDNDAVYVPTDNSVASSALTLNAASKNGDKKTPIICGDIGTCRKAGIATLTISYYDLGYTSGKMAVDILLGKVKVNQTKIRYSDKFEYKYNEDICKQCGIEIDDKFDGYTKIE